MGTRVDPARQEIRVDGAVLPKSDRVYYAVHKPPGVVSTNRDPAGRPRVIDLVPAERPAAVSGRPTGPVQRRADPRDQRWGTGQSADSSSLWGAQDLSRAGGRTPDARGLGQAHEGRSFGRGGGSGPEHSRRQGNTRRAPCWKWCSTRGGTARSAAFWPAWGTRCYDLVRIAVGPVRLGKLPPGASRRLVWQEVDALRKAVQKRPREHE